MAVTGTKVMPAKTGAAKAPLVFVLFWPAALVAAMAAAVGVQLDSPTATYALAGLILLGGLPHGAFDIALATRAWRLGHRATAAIVGAYLGVGAAMALAWFATPSLALVLFLGFSALHFGEDWTMLEAGLLRAMAGLSVIASAAIGQPDDVSALFVLLAPEGGAMIARAAMALAPVALLVTVVGLVIAWGDGARQWAVAQATALLCLLTMPPTLGFFLYFVLLHAPRHLAGLEQVLPGWSVARLWLYGGAITTLALLFAAVLGPGFWSGDPAGFAAEGFRILSIVAAPHLLLSIAMDRRIAGAA